jgi:hypothetical protein
VWVGLGGLGGEGMGVGLWRRGLLQLAALRGGDAWFRCCEDTMWDDGYD